MNTTMKKFEITLERTETRTVVVDASEAEDALRQMERDPENKGWQPKAVRAFVAEALRPIVGRCRQCFETVYGDEEYTVVVLTPTLGWTDPLHGKCKKAFDLKHGAKG